jgi:hypothetical protein
LIERMQAMLGGREQVRIKTLPPEEALVEDIRARHGARLLHAELRAERLIVVLDVEPAHIATEQTRLALSLPRVEVLDPGAWEAVRRLVEFGVVSFAEARVRILHHRDANGANGQGAPTAIADMLRPQQEARVA